MSIRRVLTFLFLSLAIAAVLTWSAQRVPILNSFEYWTGDWRTALLSNAPKEQHKTAALVLIDEETLERFGTDVRSPMDRALLADLVRAIGDAAPKAVGLDFIFDLKTANDEKLLEAVHTSQAPLVLGEAAPPIKLTPKQSAFQAAFLKQAGRPFGYTNIATDLDNVVRGQGARAPDGLATLSFCEALAASAGKSVENRVRRVDWLVGKNGVEVIPTIPAWLLLPALNERRDTLQTAKALLKDRIVILGADLFGGQDRHLTPLSNLTGEPALGSFIQAQLVAQIWDGRENSKLPPYAMFLLSTLMALASALTAFSVAERDWLQKWLPIVIYMAADAIAFSQFDLVLPFAVIASSWLGGVAMGGFARTRGYRKIREQLRLTRRTQWS